MSHHRSALLSASSFHAANLASRSTARRGARGGKPPPSSSSPSVYPTRCSTSPASSPEKEGGAAVGAPSRSGALRRESHCSDGTTAAWPSPGGAPSSPPAGQAPTGRCRIARQGQDVYKRWAASDSPIPFASTALLSPPLYKRSRSLSGRIRVGPRSG